MGGIQNHSNIKIFISSSIDITSKIFCHFLDAWLIKIYIWMKKADLWSVTDTFTLINLACFYPNQLTNEEYNNLIDSS